MSNFFFFVLLLLYSCLPSLQNEKSSGKISPLHFQLSIRSALYSAKLNTTTATASDIRGEFFSGEKSHFWTLATDYNRSKVFFSDLDHNFMGVYDVKEKENHMVFRGLSYGIDGIAVDWYTGNVYWTDTYIQRIIVAESNVEYYRNIISIDSNMPARMAIHPLKNSLFWSEVKPSSTHLYVSDLAGENPKLLHDLDVFRIGDLTVDVSENRLYWCDYESFPLFSGTRIVYINIDKPQEIIQLHSSIQTEFSSVASLGNFVYATNTEKHAIFSFDKTTNTTSNVFPPVPEAELKHVAIYSPQAQPWSESLHQMHPCYQHNCEQLCLVNSNNAAVCSCANGYTLQQDGLTCSIKILDDNFIIGLDAEHKKIYQISTDDPFNYAALTITLSGVLNSVAYDFSKQTVYWSDGAVGMVWRSHLDGSSQEVFLSGVSVTSLAIDSSSRNLYAVDANADSIVVASLDLPDITSTIHVESLYNAWHLVISNKLKKIFWTDWGQTLFNDGLIESMNFDGSGREVIANETNLPYGVAIDEQASILYWTTSTAIVWMNLMTKATGRFETGFGEITGSYIISGIDVYQEYLYIADSAQTTIHRVLLSTVQTQEESQEGDIEDFGPAFYGLSDVHVYTSSSSSGDETECATNRGSCPQICLPVSSSTSSFKQCVCQDHYKYISQNNSCVKVTDPDDITPPSFGDTCPSEQTVRVDECSNSGTINFTLPTATDDSGVVVIKNFFEGEPPLSLRVGFHQLLVRAQDNNGNSAYCQIRVNVIDVPDCSLNVTYPQFVDPDKKTCENQYGSRATGTCTYGGQFAVEFYCSVEGIWELTKGPEVCSKVPLPSTAETMTTGPAITQANPSLSSGAIAGIVIGVLAIILLVVGIIICFRGYSFSFLSWSCGTKWMPLLSCQLITPWANNNDNFAAVVAAYPRFPWDRGTICEDLKATCGSSTNNLMTP